MFQNRCFLLAQRCRTNATFGEVTINLRCEKVAKNPPSEEPIFHEKSVPFSGFVEWENDRSRNTSSIWRPLLRIQSGLTFTFGQFSLADICSIFAFFDEFGSVGLWRASGEVGGESDQIWRAFGEALGKLWGSFGEALGRLWGGFERLTEPTDRPSDRPPARPTVRPPDRPPDRLHTQTPDQPALLQHLYKL